MPKEKLDEIRNLTVEEIKNKIDSSKEKLFSFYKELKTGNLENTSQIKQTRKTIARLKTFLKEKTK